MTQPTTTRAQRLAMPLARDVVRDLAVSHGGCVRPIQLRRTDLQHRGQCEPDPRPVRAHPGLGLPVLRRTGQGRSGRPSAGKAGTSTVSRSSRPGRARTTEQRMVGRAARRGPARARPGRAARARTRAELDDAERRAGRGDHPLGRCAATCCLPGRPAVTGPPGGGRTRRTCPGARSQPGRSARRTRPRTARRSARRCSSR